MKSATRLALWSPVAVISIWALVYFIRHYSSANFQEGAMGNLFATILGIAVGIPIAMEVNRWQQSAQNASSLTAKIEEELKRKTKVLSLIKSELHKNLDDVLARRQQIAAGGKRTVAAIPLRDELWSSFSDGGELQHVNNPDVLSSIASAYHHIRTTIYLEKEFLTAVHYPGMQIKSDKYPHEHILGYLTGTDNDLILEVTHAIEKIDIEVANSQL